VPSAPPKRFPYATTLTGPAHEAVIRYEQSIDKLYPDDESIPITDVLADWVTLLYKAKPIPAPRTKWERLAQDWFLLSLAELQENGYI